MAIQGKGTLYIDGRPFGNVGDLEINPPEKAVDEGIGNIQCADQPEGVTMASRNQREGKFIGQAKGRNIRYGYPWLENPNPNTLNAKYAGRMLDARIKTMHVKKGDK